MDETVEQIQYLIEQRNFKHAFEQIDAMGDMYWKHFMKAEIYISQKTYEEAQAYHFMADKIARKQNNVFLELKCIQQSVKLYNAFFRTDRYKKALKRLDTIIRHISYFEERFTKNEDGAYLDAKIMQKEHIMKYYNKEKNIDKVLETMQSIIELSKVKRKHVSIAYAIQHATVAKMPLPTDIEQSVISENIDGKNLIDINYNFGLHYIMLQDYETAHAYLEKALDGARAYNSSQKELKALENMSQTAFWMGMGADANRERHERINKIKQELQNHAIVSEYPAKRTLEKNSIFRGENMFSPISKLENDMWIYDDDFVVLRGPSGSGKSTFTRYMLGFDHPKEGRILFGDTEIGKLSVEEMTRIRVEKMAYVIEGRVVIPTMGKWESNEQTLQQHSMKLEPAARPVIAKIFDQLSAQNAKLVPFFLQLVQLFGMKPEVIIMDEPFAHMSKKEVEFFLQLLSVCHRHEKIPIVIETHHESSLKYSTCQYFLRDGKITAVLETS